MLLPIGPLGTNFNEILIKIQNFSFTEMHLKLSSAKWRPFCPGGEELSSGPVYIRYSNLVITRPADALAPCSSRPSAEIYFHNLNIFLTSNDFARCSVDQVVLFKMADEILGNPVVIPVLTLISPKVPLKMGQMVNAHFNQFRKWSHNWYGMCKWQQYIGNHP